MEAGGQDLPLCLSLKKIYLRNQRPLKYSGSRVIQDTSSAGVQQTNPKHQEQDKEASAHNTFRLCLKSHWNIVIISLTHAVNQQNIKYRKMNLVFFVFLQHVAQLYLILLAPGWLFYCFESIHIRDCAVIYSMLYNDFCIKAKNACPLEKLFTGGKRVICKREVLNLIFVIVFLPISFSTDIPGSLNPLLS